MYVEPEMARYYLSILKEGKTSSNTSYKEKKFQEFHRALYKDLARRVCARYGCDDYVADDILGEVFIKIFNTTHYPENPAAFFAWVSMICKNEYVNFCRKNKNSGYLSKEAKIEQGIFSDEANSRDEPIHEDSSSSLCGLKDGVFDPPPSDEVVDRENSVPNFSKNKDVGGPYREFTALPHNVHTEDLSDDVYDEIKKKSLVECVQNALRILRSKSLDKGLAIEWQMEGLSSKEVADLLKRSDDATRRLLSDARKMLRELSAPCYEMIR